MARRTNLSRLVVIAVVAFAAAVAAVSLLPRPDRPDRKNAAALIGGPFTLTDGTGARRSDTEFRGRHMLVYFGFTNCPDLCPTALLAITQAMEKLGAKAKALVPVFITVDPERDTPDKLKIYGENFDKRIVMLTGTPAEIAAVARAYRVYYAKRKLDDGDYTMDHSGYMYLMGPDGKFITHFRSAISADNLAAALAKRL
jgi:protein SCO1/2